MDIGTYVEDVYGAWRGVITDKICEDNIIFYKVEEPKDSPSSVPFSWVAEDRIKKYNIAKG